MSDYDVETADVAKKPQNPKTPIVTCKIKLILCNLYRTTLTEGLLGKRNVLQSKTCTTSGMPRSI